MTLQPGDPRLTGRAEPDPDVVAQRLDEGAVVINLRTNRFYELNRTGARLWELIESGAGLAQIQERMLEEFDVDPADLAGEITAMLAALREAGLVRLDEDR